MRPADTGDQLDTPALVQSGAARRVPVFTLLAGAAGLTALLSLVWSSVSIPADQVIDVLLGREVEREAWRTIVLDIRLPRILTAALVGAALGVSGLQMQTVFHNPLASPYTLGVVAGASLGAAVVIILVPSELGGLYRQAGSSGTVATLFSRFGVVTGAALGAAAVLALMLLLASLVREMTVVLLFGVALAALLSAVVTVLVYFADAGQTRAFVEWGFGSFQRTRWGTMPYFAVPVALGVGLALATVKPLNALLLGENYARSLGVNVRRARWGILASSALLAGTVVAYAGPIAFLGIAIPHVARGLFGTSDHRVLLPGCVLLGSVIAMICGIVAELPGQNLILPINAATALFGAPITFWVLLRRYRAWEG